MYLDAVCQRTTLGHGVVLDQILVLGVHDVVRRLLGLLVDRPEGEMEEDF